MKALYNIGEVPPLGQTPESMYASVIRQERFGSPLDAFKTEVVDVPTPGKNEVLVMVMAAGVNYNNIWAASGKPVDVIAKRNREGSAEKFHIGGSDAAGVVWAVGDEATGVEVGDHVVLAPAAWDETSRDIRLGADPTTSRSQRAWGYELNWGSFAQFCLVRDFQCFPKPEALTWEEAASYMATGATAYRQLLGWHPNVVRPGDPILIWGGAGGLGSMAIQLTKLYGGVPIAVVSDDAKRDYCLSLGAKGVINRKDFDHWGRLPDIDDEGAFARWIEGARRFGEEFWRQLGEKRAPKIVFEHSGEDTIPTSIYMCDNAGMVVTCGGTSGYNADVDLRFLWMRQKRFQGSHAANLGELDSVTRLVAEGRLKPCLSDTFTLDTIGEAHQRLLENTDVKGNLAALVNAPRTGMTGL